MNQSQIKYARERAESIFKARKQSIIDANTTPAKKLDEAGKLDALRIGSFVIDEALRRNGYYGWAEKVRFTAEAEAVVLQDKIDAETTALSEAFRLLIDELVLGDNEEALRLLKAFEA